MSLNDGKEVLLVLQDLSAAFDTVDHGILQKRLHDSIGLRGQALHWFLSYISGRSSSVLLNNSYSESVDLEHGVPQGSVLGPILFTIYTLPLGSMHAHEVPFQLFADDNQLINSFMCGDRHLGPRAVDQMEVCIGEVKEWLLENKLSLNAPKTDFINIVSVRRSGTAPEITVDGVKITSSDCVRDLGVLFDKNMTMTPHVKRVC
jgi:hypothetical protein